MLLDAIDRKLNFITMYRLVLYYLIFLLAAAMVLGFLGKIPYNPLQLLYSTFYLVTVSWVTNFAFARIWHAPTNVESVYITALILVFIITPLSSPLDTTYLSLAGWAAVWAVAAKYLVAIKRKHIFNPAAFGVALTALTLNQSASWWVGTATMAPFVFVGGLLVVRKLRRLDLVWAFFLTAMLTILASHLRGNTSLLQDAMRALQDTPLLFFAFVMLTEPLTSPPTENLRLGYGALVGVLFSPSMHLGSLYSTPELALLVGNVFSYLVSPKAKLILTLKEKLKLTPDVYDFIFAPSEPLKFKPGQYLEWTLPHHVPDSRGNRRYFTIASSPTESELRLGVKFYNPASSYKLALINLEPGDAIVASQLAGDFVLPKDQKRKLVFLAGGIGITPFRSMVQYLSDHGEQRSIVLFYANKNAAEVAYPEVFSEAAKKIDLKTVHVLGDASGAPPEWQVQPGRLNAQVVAREVPDFRECMFYISGPHAMVIAFRDMLAELKINHSQIKTDFFPGFA